MSDEPIHLVTSSYIPVPEEHLADLEELIRDARAGVVTGFAWVAVGPETGRRHGGFAGGLMDRLGMLAQLMLKIRQIEDIEIEKSGS